MSLKTLAKAVVKELKKVAGNKARWVGWGTDEVGIKKNLRKGEKMVYLPGVAVWVAYTI